MILRRLAVSGLKAQSRSVDLAPLTIFEGQTGSGKTSLLQAVAIAIHGVDPGLGRSLDALRPLLTDAPLEITLEDDSGFRVIRRIGQGKGASLSSDATVFPPKGERTQAQAQQRVAAEWGQLSVFLNLAEFLDQSPDKRRAFLANLAAASGVHLTFDQMCYLVQKDGMQAPGPVATRMNELCLSLNRVFEGADIQACLVLALREVTTMVSGANGQKQAALKAAEAHRHDLLEMPATALTSADLQEKLDAIVAESNVIQSELGAAEQQQRQRAGIASTLQGARQELSRWSAPSPEPPKIDDVRASLDTAQLRIDEDKQRLVVLNAQVADLIGQAKDLLTEEDTAVKLHAAYEKNVKEIGLVGGCQLADQPGCTYAGNLAWAKEQAVNRDAQAALLPPIRARLSETRQALGERRWQVTDLQEKIAAGEKLMPSLRNAIAQYDKAVQQREVHEATREATVKALQAQIEVNEAELQVPVPDLELLGTQVASVDARLTDLKEQMRTVAQREGVLIAKADAERRAADMEIEVEALKRLQEILGPSGLLGEITKKLLQPLEEAANTAFLDRLPYGWRLVFVTKDQKDNEILDFGVVKADQRLVRWNGLSTGEQLAVGVALVMGLVAIVKPKLRLLMVDNLSLVDAQNRLPFVAACHEMVKRGDLDSVLIASNEPIGFTGELAKTVILTLESEHATVGAAAASG